MLESAVKIPLYKEDLEYIGRHGVPVVIVYNGRDHFVPSIIMSQVEYNQWKLSILVKFAEASLDVIDDVDSDFVSPEVAVHLTNMKEQFLTTRALCSEEAPPAKTAAAAARVRKSHEPLFSSAIPSCGVPRSSVGYPLTSSHVPSTPSRCTSRKGKTGPKQHICQICGIAKSRKSDLKDHLSDVHHIRSPRVCNSCKKQFKYKKGLKQHEKNQHEGKFKHNCEEEDCNFGTDSKLFQTHRVRFHDESPPNKTSVRKSLMDKVC